MSIQAARNFIQPIENDQTVEELTAAAGEELTPEELQDIAAGAAAALGHWCVTHGGGHCKAAYID